MEAIGKKQARIPYRESKMTRILSLGQNNGLTIMILNLSPVRSYHLDTLSSLNFANRTKKIEVREVENEPIFKGCSRAVPTFTGASIQRQPLRPLASTVHNVSVGTTATQLATAGDKPSKAFSVFSDHSKPRQSHISSHPRRGDLSKRASPMKRPSDSHNTSRPSKLARPSSSSNSKYQPNISPATIEGIIEKKVCEILATRALDQASVGPVSEISGEVQRRLELLEQKIEGKDDGRAEGLTFLLMAKQHHVRGEESSALKMYELAKNYFPNHAKLDTKIAKLREKLAKKRETEASGGEHGHLSSLPWLQSKTPAVCDAQKIRDDPADDDEYQDVIRPVGNPNSESDDEFRFQPKIKKSHKPAMRYQVTKFDEIGPEAAPTPRTKHLLGIINTRDTAQIRLLKGVGAKKAEVIVDALCSGGDDEDDARMIASLWELGKLKGVGAKTVENMRMGLGEFT